MPPPLVDPIDRLIASALVADGRATLKTLAEATGLSVSAVQARVRRLESDGVIERLYRPASTRRRSGLPLAAIIAITPLDPAHEYDIPARIASLTEIESCHSVAGEDSFVLFVRVASPTALEELIREIRTPRQRVDADHGGAADILRAASPTTRSSDRKDSGRHG